MSWAGIAGNQCVSFNNLQDAVTTGVFFAKTTIPVSGEQITKTDANTYAFIDTTYGPYASKSSNQLVVKNDLLAAPCECRYGQITDNNSFNFYDCDGVFWSGGAELNTEICFDINRPRSANIGNITVDATCICGCTSGGIKCPYW
jgi:hypothetical protein